MNKRTKIATRTTQLQYVGLVDAMFVHELEIGDRVMWNGGTSTEIVAIEAASKCFSTVTFRNTDHNGTDIEGTHDRRMKNDRIVGVPRDTFDAFTTRTARREAGIDDKPEAPAAEAKPEAPITREEHIEAINGAIASQVRRPNLEAGGESTPERDSLYRHYLAAHGAAQFMAPPTPADDFSQVFWPNA
jgi:hypothetical protein